MLVEIACTSAEREGQSLWQAQGVCDFHPLFDRDDDDDQDGCSEDHEDDHHEGIYLLVSSFSRASVDWPAVVAAICLAFTWRYSSA